MSFAETLVLLAALYAGAGLLFAMAFVWGGVARIDPAARGSSVMFRLLMVPGSAALWPILMLKWTQVKGRP